MSDDTGLPVHNAALAAVVERFVVEYHGVFNRETIEQFVDTSYAEFGARAKIKTFLPRNVERFVGERLQALARLDGRSSHSQPVVLFLCVHNAGRSQMALGWFDRLAAGRAIGWSGGSEPGREVDPDAVTAMAEIGIDITGEFPKPWTDEIVRAADVVIAMGCGDSSPRFPGKHYEDWELKDPNGESLDVVREIRDEIGDRVHDLVNSLGLDAT